MQNKIVIKGAREHNLKNINLELPRNKMIVFTGLSGSGKSSLAFDTIFAEGQRRYVESLSAYARQFLGNMQKPDIDEIEGLSPGISIDQKAHSANPRSTVATITEIYDYLRVLYARIGKPYSPETGKVLEKMTTDQITERITTLFDDAEKKQEELIIMSRVIRGRKGEYYQMLYDLYNSGYLEVRVDGKMYSLREQIKLSKHKKHIIDVVIDKIPASSTLKDKDTKERLAYAVEQAVELSNESCIAIYPDGIEQEYSTDYVLPEDGTKFPDIEPRLFSFNSPYGYCKHCTGLGTKELFSEFECPVCEGKRLNEYALAVKVAEKNIYEITSMTIAEAKTFFEELYEKLEEKEKEIVGAAMREIQNRIEFIHNVGLHYLSLHRKAGTLSGGEAQRIRLASQVGQQLVGAMYVLDEPTIGLHQKDNERLVSTLRNLCDIGNTIIVVEHDEDTILTSDWVVDIGPGAGKHGGDIIYSGPLYHLLESKDKEPKTKAGKNVKSIYTIKSSEKQKKLTTALDCKVYDGAKKSLTGQYLRGEKKIDIPEKRRKVDRATPKIKIKGAEEHNLKHINVDIPLRRFVCLTGVSGSGKSTLMNSILYRAVANKLHHVEKRIGKHKEIRGTEYIDKIIRIDQSPIGRTPRSNPATYTKAYDAIRDIFAATTESRVRGYKKGRFSFNRPGGRCDHCEGKGSLKIEMHFLPSVQIICEACNGKRFNNETLQVHYKGKNISDILNMTIEDAEKFFVDIPQINDKLSMLNQVGLNYLTLGQSAITLSGGEAQRVKLSKELAKRNTTKTLYLLDEPTTGLHYEDVKKLIYVLQKLVSQGNTVMIIEHNLDLIKCADWVIDLGIEGGDKGGEIVAIGTPEDIARNKDSFTGKYLKKLVS
jgi:excinuclease ABC subunit A